MKKTWYIIKSNGYVKCADKRQLREIFESENGMYAVHTSSKFPDCSKSKKYYFCFLATFFSAVSTSPGSGRLNGILKVNEVPSFILLST